MAKSVFIIRHAKSSWDDPELHDIVRPLNNRGRQAAQVMGMALAKMHIRPDLVFSSPATRAFHTAITVSQAIGYRLRNIFVEPAIYFEGDQAMIDIIRGLAEEVETIMIFGHEPYCSSVCEFFTGEDIDKFPTGACYRITFAEERWADVKAVTGRKELFLKPKELKL